MAKNESPPDPAQIVTVSKLLADRGAEWDLEVVSGEPWLDREILSFEVYRPGLALSGFYDVFSVDRVQMIGNTETAYLQSLAPEERAMRLSRTLEFPIPCVIITNSQPAADEMIAIMNDRELPLLRTSHSTSPFSAELGQYLERLLAPRAVVHGVMVEVFGLGVLIQGKSGVGKSECGLELVERGHLLIADDVVRVRRTSTGRLFGEPAPNLGYHMEIRGVGIIDIERLFGVRSVREESEVQLIVKLEKWDPEKDYERLGLTENRIMLHGCLVPRVVIPVEPGRNISQLIEVAALMRRLKTQGVNIAADFDAKMRKSMDER